MREFCFKVVLGGKLENSMNEKDIFGVVAKLLKAYLNNELNASEFVQRYDNIITDKEFPWNLDNGKIQALDEFQNEISLFVYNPEWRKEHQSYFGENELKKKVEGLLKYLEGKSNS